MIISDICEQKKNPDRANIFVDGEYSFSLDKIDVMRLNLKIGMEVSKDELFRFNTESNLSKARDKAFDMLSRRDYCVKELCEKLEKKDFSHDITEMIVRELKSLGYLDDICYAQKYIEYARMKAHGDKRIRYDLAKKGISSADISAVFENVPKFDINSLCDAIREKYRGVDFSDFKNKQRVMRYFSARGFDFSYIKQAIDLVCESEEGN